MENIIKSIKSKSKLSDNAVSTLLSYCTKLELPKRHILTSSSKRDKNFYLIEKGIARSYILVQGKEVTSWFSKEGDIAFSTNSFYGKTEGYELETVQLLEDSQLYAIPINTLEQLYETNIEIANWSRILHQEAFIAMEMRLISMLYQSAEERYLLLLKNEPELFRRVNLGYIASYLGITQVTLCNLRNKSKQGNP